MSKDAVIFDEAAMNKMLGSPIVSDYLDLVANEMVDHLKATVTITGDRSPPKSYGKAKNKGHGYIHNVGGYKALRGHLDDGRAVSWVVSTQHFTMLEFGTFDGKQPGRHYLSTTLILFRV